MVAHTSGALSVSISLECPQFHFPPVSSNPFSSFHLSHSQCILLPVFLRKWREGLRKFMLSASVFTCIILFNLHSVRDRDYRSCDREGNRGSSEWCLQMMALGLNRSRLNYQPLFLPWDEILFHTWSSVAWTIRFLIPPSLNVCKSIFPWFV